MIALCRDGLRFRCARSVTRDHDMRCLRRHRIDRLDQLHKRRSRQRRRKHVTLCKADAALEFLNANPVSYASVLDLTGEVSRNFGVTGLPTLVVIDAKGKVVHNDARLVGEGSVRDLIEATR